MPPEGYLVPRVSSAALVHVPGLCEGLLPGLPSGEDGQRHSHGVRRKPASVVECGGVGGGRDAAAGGAGWRRTTDEQEGSRGRMRVCVRVGIYVTDKCRL